jgi:hypothetical protein
MILDLSGQGVWKSCTSGWSTPPGRQGCIKLAWIAFA